MIELKNLYKSFGEDEDRFHAVKDVSLTVEDGQIFGIIGRSGAGKSTLVRLINRLEEPDSGQVWVDGVEITALDKEDLLEARRSMSMIFQHFNLLDQRTVEENVRFPLELGDYKEEEINRKVDELLAFVGLEDKRDNYPAQISGGEKQRVAIARALATEPKTILSDEGTSALDPETTEQILQLLKKTVQTYGTSIVLITHQMEVAEVICDRIALMDEGRIIEENSVSEIFNNPQDPLTKNFVLRNRALREFEI